MLSLETKKEAEAYASLMALSIDSIKGEDKSYAVNKRIVEELIGKDSMALKKELGLHQFGIINDIEHNCDSCGNEMLIPIELTAEFFRPSEL